MFIHNAATCSLAALALLSMVGSSQAQTDPEPPKKKEEGALVRIVCVQSLSGNAEEKVTLARKMEDGKWIEFGDLELTSTCITDWVRVPVGVNHVARKGGEELESLGSFTISPAVKGVLLILIPNPKEKNYRVQAIDPAKLQFRKGKALIVNYSNIPAMVNMGKETKTMAPGQQFVETVADNKNERYRMMIAYTDKDKNIVPCFDRFLSANPNTRSFILLFPDPDTGIRAMTFTEFGPFE